MALTAVVNKAYYKVQFCWFISQIDMLDKKYPRLKIAEKLKMKVVKKYPKSIDVYITKKTNELRKVFPFTIDTRRERIYDDVVKRYDRWVKQEEEKKKITKEKSMSLQEKFNKKYEEKIKARGEVIHSEF